MNILVNKNKRKFTKCRKIHRHYFKALFCKCYIVNVEMRLWCLKNCKIRKKKISYRTPINILAQN